MGIDHCIAVKKFHALWKSFHLAQWRCSQEELEKETWYVNEIAKRSHYVTLVSIANGYDTQGVRFLRFIPYKVEHLYITPKIF